MQVLGACRADERLMSLLKVNVSSGVTEDRLLSHQSALVTIGSRLACKVLVCSACVCSCWQDQKARDSSNSKQHKLIDRLSFDVVFPLNEKLLWSKKATGDGANDVGMLQEADIGVGISGA